MAKVDTELLKVVLTRNLPDVRQVANILQDIQQEIAAQIDEEKSPPLKKQFVILMADSQGNIPRNVDFTGWVLQIPEEAAVGSAAEGLLKAASLFNQSPKGRRMPLRTIAEVCEHVPAHILKEAGVWVKTKEPVYVIPLANKLT